LRRNSARTNQTCHTSLIKLENVNDKVSARPCTQPLPN